MNHCVDCGEKVSRGRTSTKTDAIRCAICEAARRLATFRYLSPAAKRYRAAAERDALRARIAELEAKHGT